MRLGVGDMIRNLDWATGGFRSVARFGFPVQFGVGGPGNVFFFFLKFPTFGAKNFKSHTILHK